MRGAAAKGLRRDLRRAIGADEMQATVQDTRLKLLALYEATRNLEVLLIDRMNKIEARVTDLELR